MRLTSRHEKPEPDISPCDTHRDSPTSQEWTSPNTAVTDPALCRNGRTRRGGRLSELPRWLPLHRVSKVLWRLGVARFSIRGDWRKRVVEFDPAIAEYYGRGQEKERLFGGFPSGPLELARTQELIGRHLESQQLRIADIGSGPGAYATWLAGLGHQVELLDPVKLHVEQARAAGFDATVGDARALPWADAEFDAVLLLGPLYHLQDKADRLTALRETSRVLVDGGWLFAAAISRFAALLDMLVRLDNVHEEGVLEVVTSAVETGEFRGADRGLFTNAYFHRADELLAELGEAGFEGGRVFNIEGPGFLVSNFADRWSDPARREAMLAAARLVEAEPSTIGASSHLLAVARL